MRKIIVSEMITVDGFFAGPNGEIDWHKVDAEFNKSAIEMLDKADTLIFGRVTYDLMASYWPTPDVIKDDPMIAERMNALAKIVFSKTPGKFSWNNTSGRTEIVADDIKKLKEQPGKDILIFGSGTIVSAFADLDLIDEYRLIVNAVVLGKGKSLFSGIKNKINLKLLKTQIFKNGNVLLLYKPEGK
jgi:dihydrofolate reductase